MKRILRFLVSIALLMGLLSGCTGAPAENNTTSTPENTPATTEPGAPAASGDTRAAWPRTITDALGNEVTIENEPQQIVVIHFSDMEYMLALDAPLIGAGFAKSRIASWDTLEPYRGKGIEDIGSSAEPSLEKVLELEPDLIIANKDYNAEIYDDLQKIAPTVLLGGYETWEDRLRATAEVVGKEDKAESYIAEIDQLVTDTRQKLSSYSNQTFGSFRIISSTEKTLNVLGSSELAAYYDAEKGLGLTLYDGYPEAWEQITLEGVVAVNPDYILLHAESKDEYDEFVAGMSQEGAWNSLKAVKNGHVIYLNISVWSGSPRAIELAAQNILAGVEQ